jgi:P27 family predicted phage terminase small subunit
MPRTKKAPGTAVDRRNGRRAELEGQALEKFSLPKRSSGEPWRLETRKVWTALWADPVAQVLTPVDRPVLLRWADSIDRAARHLELGDADPVAKGSMGQAVESPHYGIADKAIKVAQACEAQLGVGALNRARLGLTITTARKSLEDLNREFLEVSDEPDPRLG